MRTETVTLYTFAELPEEIQARVLAKYPREHFVDDSFWYEHIIDGWKEKLDRLGIAVDNIWFSGFYSQGDGACFTGRVDMADALRAGLIDTPVPGIVSRYLEDDPIGITLLHRGRYYHEQSITFDADDADDEVFDTAARDLLDATGWEPDTLKGQLQYEDYEEEFDEAIGDIIEAIEDACRDLMQDIFIDLRNEYEYLTSDEYLRKYLIDSDLEFTADGEGW